MHIKSGFSVPREKGRPIGFDALGGGHDTNPYPAEYQKLDKDLESAGGRDRSNPGEQGGEMGRMPPPPPNISPSSVLASACVGEGEGGGMVTGPESVLSLKALLQ